LRLLSPDQRFALVFGLLDFLALNEFVLGLLPSDDDPLWLTALFADDDRSSSSLANDNRLWLLKVFGAPAISF
jgi:hypothetical protein